MTLLVVFNPRAQSGRSQKSLARLQTALRKRSIDAEFLLTEQPGHGVSLVAQADLRPFDAVVAVGGDGTLFEVLNGLYQHEPNGRIPMGIIPMGTGNAFAREFGLLPGEPAAALDRLQAGQIRKIDLGQVISGNNRFHFLNILGMGFAVQAGLAAGRLKYLGKAAYTVGTLWSSLRLRSYPLVIELDGIRMERENVFMEVSNSRYTGTHFLMAPGALIDDGFLDVTLLNEISRSRLWRLFPTIYSGTHTRFKEIETFQAKHIRITEPRGPALAPDGEFFFPDQSSPGPIDIRCLHQDLELIC